MSSYNLGKAGEHLVVFDLISRGFNAWRVDDSPFDIISEINGKLVKFQVKSTAGPKKIENNLVYVFNARRPGSRSNGEYSYRGIYKLEHFDCYALAIISTREVFYFPHKEEIRKNLRFRISGVNYRYSPSACPYIDEFTLDRLMESI